MKVRDVMTPDVISVRPDASFKDMVEALLDHDVSGLPVIDDDGRLVGIVTEADLVAKEAYEGRRRRPLRALADLLAGDVHWSQRGKGLTAEAVMTPRPFAIRPGDDVAFAARRMLEHRVKRLPVVDADDRLVGIVARQDLLRVFHRSDDDIAVDVRDRLGSVRYAPEGHQVTFGVDHGVVTLDGTVLHPSDQAVVEGMVRDIRGVVAVQAHLSAREPEPTLR